jgi:hypothetical protein
MSEREKVKRGLIVYIALVVYGAVVWGVQDELRGRPVWAQYGSIALWAGIAFVFVWTLAARRDNEE